MMENSQELLGILPAISIVAKGLSEKLIRIDREIKDYEDTRTGIGNYKNRKKGKKR